MLSCFKWILAKKPSRKDDYIIKRLFKKNKINNLIKWVMIKLLIMWTHVMFVFNKKKIMLVDVASLF
jgi:hypothetical protein